MAKQPGRSVNTKQDLGSIDAMKYNDAVGADKVIVVQPTVVRTTTAGEQIGAGKLVLIAAGPYNLVMAGKDYSSAATYQKGDIAVNGGNVYMANEDKVTGTFDATKWILKAPASIASIPCPANSVVSTGRWHNSISVAGFLVDDDTEIKLSGIRD